MLGTYLMFTFADVSNKWMALAGIPPLQIAFARYAFQLLITFGEASYRGMIWPEIRDNFWLLTLRAIALASATIANFYALKYLSLSMYSAIMFSAPIFVCLLAWPMLGERVGPWRWFAIIIGFIGVLVIVRPFDAEFHWAALLSTYAAIMLALYSILTRKIAHSVSSHLMQLFAGAFGTVLLLPFAIWVWQPIELPILLLMGWVGLTSWFGHELLTRAHKLAEASVLMPYSYSFIIYMTLAGFIIYSELPDAYTILGAAIIIIAGLIIWRREQRLTVPKHNLPTHR